MTPERLTEIRELLSRSTPGTQEVRNFYQVGTYRDPELSDPGPVWKPVANCTRGDDAELFAQAHTIITELLEDMDSPP